MSDKALNLEVAWRSVWYSRYQRGRIISGPAQHLIEKIYRHEGTGQIRFYSPSDFNGAQLSVNAEPRITMRQRGRFGKLYIGE